MAEFIAYSTGTTGQGFRGKLTVTETVNTAANTSDVTWTFVIWATFSTAYNYNNGNQVYVTINGQSVYSTANYGNVSLVGTSESNPKVLCSGTTTGIAHNSDGTKSIAVSAQYIQPNASALYSINPSGTMTLTTIARASSITSMTNATVGSNGGTTTLTFTPLSNTFYYRITLTCGNWSQTTNVGGGYTAGTSRTNNISIPAGIADYITSASSATVTAVLTTYSSSAYSTVIGTSAGKTFTVTLDSTFNPDASFTVTYYQDFNSQYLCNRTYIRVTPTFYGSHGATLSGYQYIVSNSSGTVVQSGTGNTYWESSTFSASGRYTVTLKVTDSRSKTATAGSMTAFDMVDYNKPSFSSYSVARGTYEDNVFVEDGLSGTYAQITFNVAYAAVTGNTLYVQYKLSTDEYWTTITSPTVIGTFSIDNSYLFQLRTYDSVSGSSTAVVIEATLPSAAFPLDFLPSGNGAAFGKVAQTENELEINWALKVNEDADIDGDMSVGGDLSVDGKEYLSDGIIAKNYSSGLNSHNVYFLPYVPYSVVDPTHDTSTYFKALLRWICTHYPNVTQGLWIGLVNPNASGPALIHIYDTSDVDTNGNPRYANCMWMQLGAVNLFRFGYTSFTWYEGTNT